jgi:hypothetical protein
LAAIRHRLFRPNYAELVPPEPICRITGDAQQQAAICPRVVWEVAIRSSEYMPGSPFIDCDIRCLAKSHQQPKSSGATSPSDSR